MSCSSAVPTDQADFHDATDGEVSYTAKMADGRLSRYQEVLQYGMWPMIGKKINPDEMRIKIVL